MKIEWPIRPAVALSSTSGPQALSSQLYQPETRREPDSESHWHEFDAGHWQVRWGESSRGHRDWRVYYAAAEI